jgi:ABC-2 type transport system ATP-binding protein
VIKIDALYKRYRKKQVLNSISCKFNVGCTGLLGPNGSGKTTMIKILSGVEKYNSGNILFYNKQEHEIERKKVKIGYLPQNFGLIKDYTVYEHMELFACLKGLPKTEWNKNVDYVLNLLNLSDIKNVKCRALSGGMVRRIGIAQAILGNPDVIIFDEPTTGLDPEERIRFQNIILQIKKHSCVIIATHLIEDVMEICDNVMVLAKGDILFLDKTERLAEVAANRVYNIKYDTAKVLEQTGIIVKSQYGEQGNVYARYILDKDVTQDEFKEYECIEPQIEDGYLSLLREHRKNYVR